MNILQDLELYIYRRKGELGCLDKGGEKDLEHGIWPCIKGQVV